MHQRGFILVSILVLSAVMLGLLAILLSSNTTTTLRLAQRTARLQAEALADAGLEQALIQLRSNASFSGESYSLGNGSVTTTITADGRARTITARAVIDGIVGGTVSRTHRLVAQGDPDQQGQAFSFAIQTDTGGFATASSKNPKITGSLYSNQNVDLLGGGSEVTGNVSAVGTITNQGKIGGTVTAGAPAQPLPVVDVAGWKTAAMKGQTHTGDLVISDNQPVTLGAPTSIGVITGKLKITANTPITLVGPVWIKGANGVSIEITANPDINLSESVRQSVILCDGTILLNGNATFATPSDTNDLLVMTTAPNATYTPNSVAIDINANARFINAGLYAPNGTLQLGPSASGLSITAFAAARIYLNSNAKIDYSHGLIDANFTPNGPTGGNFTILAGSYQLPSS